MTETDVYGVYNYLLVLIAEVVFVILVAYLNDRLHLRSRVSDNRYIYIAGLILAFTVMGICTTHFMTAEQDDGTMLDARNLLISCASFIGGPAVGIPTAFLVAAERLTAGGPAAIPCFISILVTGIASALLYRLSGNGFPPVIIATLYMLAMEMLYIALIGTMYGWYRLGDAATEVLGSALGMFLCAYVYFREVERRRGKGEIPWM